MALSYGVIEERKDTTCQHVGRSSVEDLRLGVAGSTDDPLGRGQLCCTMLCQVISVMSNSATLWTVVHPAPLSMGILQARMLEYVAMPSSRGSLNPGMKPRSPACQVDSLPLTPPGEPKRAD